MSIHFSAGAPTGTHLKLQRWASQLQRVSTFSTAAGAPLTLGDAYKVVYLSLKDIAAGRLLAAAQSSAWRHLLTYGGQSHGELELDASDEPVALHEGPAKDGLPLALATANGLAGDYEARVIEAPPLRFIGLWLHDDARDWIIPFAPNLTALSNYVAVTEGDVLAVLQPMAADILQASLGNPSSAG